MGDGFEDRGRGFERAVGTLGPGQPIGRCHEVCGENYGLNVNGFFTTPILWKGRSLPGRAEGWFSPRPYIRPEAGGLGAASIPSCGVFPPQLRLGRSPFHRNRHRLVSGAPGPSSERTFARRAVAVTRTPNTAVQFHRINLPALGSFASGVRMAEFYSATARQNDRFRGQFSRRGSQTHIVNDAAPISAATQKRCA